MKLSSLAFGLIVGIVIMIIFPLGVTQINYVLHLPVFTTPLTQLVGLLLILIGSALFIYCSVIFKIQGKGTPIPIEAPTQLVTTGIYAYTRNPIYLGYWLIVLGEFLWLGHLLLIAYLLIFMVVNHIYVIYEEKTLQKRFNGEYLAYVQKVPRYVPSFLLPATIHKNIKN